MAAANTVKTADEPRVQIVLPRLADEGMGIKVDQTEHVTINGSTTVVPRGVYVDVTVPVFEILKTRYPNL